MKLATQCLNHTVIKQTLGMLAWPLAWPNFVHQRLPHNSEHSNMSMDMDRQCDASAVPRASSRPRIANGTSAWSEEQLLTVQMSVEGLAFRKHCCR